ncbi:helix-turn-helix domain-containing protein [Xanthomonas sp. NCPPB 1128]|uniref:helix-turn-helix domain-containing protein n=1 Tax=Xanthomonas sp. NCPPB 1128 TaxID=1775876 RepID=UPI00138F166D|nr:helix-turn-helix domain-containing protein [Xanthomonas sp. NCPPB 1128]
MTKQAVKKALKLETDAELARFFGIGRWAVGQWKDEKPIPPLRQFQARDLRPDVFGPPPAKKRRKAA